MRILLVDDHALFRQTLRVLLMTKGYEVVGMAADGIEALQQGRVLHPDLILMDIQMPVCDGLTATRLIKAEMPEVTIVMLTVSTSDDNLFEAIKSGASGYMLKSESADRLLQMVDEVARGGAPLSPTLAARLLDEFARLASRAEAPAGTPTDGLAPYQGLTPRQLEILTLVSQGSTYAQIGELLCLSETTVRYHMAQIMNRLHLDNRAQVIAFAARHGLGGDKQTR